MMANQLRIVLVFVVATLFVACSTSRPAETAPPQPQGESEQRAQEASEQRATTQDERQLPTEEYVGELETVALFEEMMPTGVTVSEQGRVFVNFPRWGDDVPYTVAEIVDGEARAYPSESINEFVAPYDDHLVSVQSVVVGPGGDLWLLDTGRPEFQAPVEGGQKLMRINLETDEIVETIPIGEAALESTYLNDVRFDMRRGEGGMAFITDSSSVGPNGIIVVDLANQQSWRKLSGHPSTAAEEAFLPMVEGRPLMQRSEDGEASYMQVGSDGIALSEDGSRLFFRALAGRRLFSVSIDALADRTLPDEQVEATLTDHGDLGFASDGLIHDTAGNLYLTNYEDNGVVRRTAEGDYETLVHDPRVLWPDTLAIGPQGYLYLTANQLHRQASYQGGDDLRQPPYVLFRVQVDAEPVQLR